MYRICLIILRIPKSFQVDSFIKKLSAVAFSSSPGRVSRLRPANPPHHARHSKAVARPLPRKPDAPG